MFDRSRTVGKISSSRCYLVYAIAFSRKSTGNGRGRTVAPEPQQPATHDPTDSLFSFPTTSHPFANPSQNPSSLLSLFFHPRPVLSSPLFSSQPLRFLSASHQHSPPLLTSPRLTPLPRFPTPPYPLRLATLALCSRFSPRLLPHRPATFYLASPFHRSLPFPPATPCSILSSFSSSTWVHMHTHVHTRILMRDEAHGNGISSVSGNGPSLRAFRSSTFVVATNNSYPIFPSRNQRFVARFDGSPNRPFIRFLSRDTRTERTDVNRTKNLLLLARRKEPKHTNEKI